MTKTKLLTGAALIAIATCSGYANDIAMYESTINPRLSSSTLVDMSSKTVGGFTLERLSEMGAYADLAYVNPNDSHSRHMQTINLLREQGHTITFFATARENSGYVLEKANGEVVVAYHGTSSFANLATDVWGNRCLMEDMVGGAHNGFYNGFQQTIDQIMGTLNQIALRQGKTLNQLQIRVTGHSMGAGLAGLLAKYLDEVHNVSNLKAALFACPMFLDSVGAKDYQNRKIGKNTIIVIEDGSDPVPHMDGHLAVAGAGLLGAAVAGPAGLGLAAMAYPVSFFGNHVGEMLLVNKPAENYVHTMGGYNKAIADMLSKKQSKIALKANPPAEVDALVTMPTDGKVTDKKVSKFKPTTIVKSAAANLRDGFHEHVIYPVHKAFKGVKDKAIKMVK